jgi:4-hydroxy-3-polyprenylbenzoate decarboxylase
MAGKGSCTRCSLGISPVSAPVAAPTIRPRQDGWTPVAAGISAAGWPTAILVRVGFADLQDFLGALERDGDLARVRVPVDPHLEVTGIVQRVLREGGPALVFEHPTRGRLPLAMNLFGTRRRMARALGVDDLDQIGRRIGELLKPELPRGAGGLKDALSKVGQLRSVPPRHVKAASAQEIVLHGDDIDLVDLLPGVKAWPEDGGAFLNLGLTHTKHPETGARNLGMYRLQLQDERTVSLHWQIHKDSTSHAAIAERRGERLPVAIAFGCPPAVTYAASAPLPADIDEYLFAGFLQRDRVELVDCVSVPLQVPAAAQVVLEGWVEPGARLPEGPFGDHTGFYTPVEPFPYIRVETLTMRTDAIFQSIIVGRPPQEDGPIGKATERIFLPLIQLTVPEIADYDLPEAGVFHNCVIVSIEKRFPKHAQKVMNAIWGAGLLSLSKLIVVVDADCDVHDYAEVAWRAFGNVDYAHDALHSIGPVDHLDHASYEQFFGGKLGIDATRKLPTEGYRREGGWPKECVLDDATLTTVERRWREYGIGRGRR